MHGVTMDIHDFDMSYKIRLRYH